MSVTKDIGDAVVAYINNATQQATYNTAFIATWVNMPLRRLEDLGEGLHVIVFPGPRTVSPFTHRSVIKSQSIVVALVIRRPKENIPLEDIHVELSEQVENSLWKTEASVMGVGKRLEDSDLTIPPFTPEELERNGLLLSFVPLTYSYEVKP